MGLGDDSISWAVDFLYAENINDKLYGLLVPRNVDGTLAAHHSYRLLVTRGKYDDFKGSTYDWNAGCLKDCKLRRFQVINIKPYEDDSGSPVNFFWRPLGLTYYQEYDTTSMSSPLETTRLITYFRPLR